MSNFNGQFKRKKPEVAYIEVNLKNENLNDKIPTTPDRLLSRCRSSPTKLNSEKKRKDTFAQHELTTIKLKSTIDDVVRARSELARTLMETN